MNKYPLIGVSICAVVLLVLASLTNVVGYQSVHSSAVPDSPLFSIRTQRAIDQENKGTLTSDYLGKGMNHNLLILPRISETDTLREVINRIKTMDDNSFERFVRSAVAQLSKQEQLNDITPQQLITGLHQIRGNAQAFMDYTGSNNGNTTWKPNPTLCWFPGCLIIFIFQLIWVIIINHFPTSIYHFSVCFCP
jgi:hypothetical protein